MADTEKFSTYVHRVILANHPEIFTGLSLEDSATVVRAILQVLYMQGEVTLPPDKEGDFDDDGEEGEDDGGPGWDYGDDDDDDGGVVANAPMYYDSPIARIEWATGEPIYRVSRC